MAADRMDYNEALDYLYSLINYELQRPDRYTPHMVSLDRPRALMERFGSPQETYPIIHVTGTKGKGSVSAMCAAVLKAAGLRVGLYSSPHLQDFRERFRVNDEMIEPEMMAALVEQVKPYVEKIPGLTWFEVTTAIAFLYFQAVKVDVAVIEVGLGGRLDATNIISAPLVSAITSLSYDHQYLLGNTLTDIAFEKGGIIKPGIPVVSAPQHAEPLEKLKQIALERSAPLIVAGSDTQFASEKADEFGQFFTASLPGHEPQRYWTPLLGEHQVINAATALAALHFAREAGIPISDEAIRTGFRLVNWPGRLEVVRRSPHIVLDVAHNGESAQRLTNALTTLFPDRKVTLIFGAFTDKDVVGMFKALLPHTEHLILMQALNPRAFGTEALAEMARTSGYTGSIDLTASAQDALNHAESLVSPDDLICVTGSVSVVGEMRTVLNLAPTRAAYLDENAVQTLQRTV